MYNKVTSIAYMNINFYLYDDVVYALMMRGNYSYVQFIIPCSARVIFTRMTDR